jgi:hypothetical protein
VFQYTMRYLTNPRPWDKTPMPGTYPSFEPNGANLLRIDDAVVPPHYKSLPPLHVVVAHSPHLFCQVYAPPPVSTWTRPLAVQEEIAVPGQGRVRDDPLTRGCGTPYSAPR